MAIHYLNTDLDLAAPVNLSPLVAVLEARGLMAIRCEQSAGIWYAALETLEQYTEPDETIGAMLSAVEALEGDALTLWQQCHQRDFDIGYECGDAPAGFHSRLSTTTLKRISDLDAGLAITLYPERT
jgi:hypothetical protein